MRLISCDTNNLEQCSRYYIDALAATVSRGVGPVSARLTLPPRRARPLSRRVDDEAIVSVVEHANEPTPDSVADYPDIGRDSRYRSKDRPPDPHGVQRSDGGLIGRAEPSS